MSIKAVNWALNDVQCQPDFKVILIAMGERADDNGFCFPTQAELSRKTCIPLRTLKRKVHQLTELNVITKVTKQVERNLRRNSYRLHLELKFDMLDKRTVSAKTDSAKLAPLSEESKMGNSAALAPSIVPERHHTDEQWCHPDGTQNGATQVAYKPSLNHQSNSINADTTTDADHAVFQPQPPARRDRITMHSQWRPTGHVFEKLRALRNIDQDFAEEQLAGFVIYHDQVTDRHAAFDAKFHAHVIRNWEQGKCQPRQINPNWQPDEVTIRQVRQMGIPAEFIQERAAEFVMYWAESGRACHGWNAKFFDAVCRAWNRALPAESASRTAGASAVGRAVSEHNSNTLISRLTDRSWAEG